MSDYILRLQEERREYQRRIVELERERDELRITNAHNAEFTSAFEYRAVTAESKLAAAREALPDIATNISYGCAELLTTEQADWLRDEIVRQVGAALTPERVRELVK